MNDTFRNEMERQVPAEQLGDGFANAPSSSFTMARTFDYRFDLPVQDLGPGEYLLTVDVVADRKTAQRAVRFRVQSQK